MAEGTGKGEALSVWFFVGIMTLLYGLVLLPYGLYAWLGGHEAPTVLNNLHPTFWWGLLLTIFGAFYTITYRPKPCDRNKA
jgi:peptidoglycan/LPS O-acetylase OafA/YrhL